MGKIYLELFSDNGQPIFCETELLNWLSLNLQYFNWWKEWFGVVFFGVVLDRLWQRRNEYTFQQKWITNASLIASIDALVHDFHNNKTVQLSLNVDGVSNMYSDSAKNKRYWSSTLNCDRAVSSEVVCCFERFKWQVHNGLLLEIWFLQCA